MLTSLARTRIRARIARHATRQPTLHTSRGTRRLRTCNVPRIHKRLRPGRAGRVQRVADTVPFIGFKQDLRAEAVEASKKAPGRRARLRSEELGSARGELGACTSAERGQRLGLRRACRGAVSARLAAVRVGVGADDGQGKAVDGAARQRYRAGRGCLARLAGALQRRGCLPRARRGRACGRLVAV